MERGAEEGRSGEVEAVRLGGYDGGTAPALRATPPRRGICFGMLKHPVRANTIQNPGNNFGIKKHKEERE